MCRERGENEDDAAEEGGMSEAEEGGMRRVGWSSNEDAELRQREGG